MFFQLIFYKTNDVGSKVGGLISPVGSREETITQQQQLKEHYLNKIVITAKDFDPKQPDKLPPGSNQISS